MTEEQIREQVVEAARSYLGCNESDGSHKQIIDLYNTQNPLPRNYPVKYSDAWCATFVSAIGVKLGLLDIMYSECSCPKMITLYANKGRWMEDDAYVPKPGDIMMYDFNDNGSGDNKGAPDHVGIVEVTNGINTIVIEGNYANSVKRRYIAVDGKYIRGYCLPNYASKAEQPIPAPTPAPAEKSILKKGSNGPEVKELQNNLITLGYNIVADGDFGSATQKAVKEFQKDHGLAVDGIVGAKTYEALDKALADLEKEASYTKEDFIREVQSIIGTTVDGIADSETLDKTITVSRYKNSSHAIVKPIQKRLYALGFTEVGEADGIAGSAFQKAMKNFQRANGCYVDGEATARMTTWKKLLGMC